MDSRLFKHASTSLHRLKVFFRNVFTSWYADAFREIKLFSFAFLSLRACEVEALAARLIFINICLSIKFSHFCSVPVNRRREEKLAQNSNVIDSLLSRAFIVTIAIFVEFPFRCRFKEARKNCDNFLSLRFIWRTLGESIVQVQREVMLNNTL